MGQDPNIARLQISTADGVTHVDAVNRLLLPSGSFDVTGSDEATLKLRIADVYNVKSYGAIGDGATDDRAALNTLVNTRLQITGAGGDVYFPVGDYSIQSAMTFPANVRLIFDKRARLKPANGVTITDLTDHSFWDRAQKFTNALAGQGAMSWTGTKFRLRFYPEWWGAAGGVESTAPIQAAIDSLGDTSTMRHGEVSLSACYIISNTLIIDFKAIWLHGNGLGNATTGQGSALVWNGAAGIPMVNITQSFAPIISDLRFIGKSSAKPSAAINFNEGTSTTTNPRVFNVWIGYDYFDPTGGTGVKASGQFTNGILFDGNPVNGELGKFDLVHIFGAIKGVNILSVNAADHSWSNLWVENCNTGFSTVSSQVGTAWFFANNDVDMALTENGAFLSLHQFASESSGRMLTMTTGKFVRFDCVACSWQVGPNLASDGYFIDTGGISNAYVAVTIKQAYFQDVGGHGAIVPKIRMRGNQIQILHLIDAPMTLTEANFDVTPDSQNDPDAVREIVIEGTNQANAPYYARNILSYPDTLDFTRVDDYKDHRVRGKLGINSIPGASDASLRIVGGGAKVEQIATPSAPFVQSIGTAGATSYTYYLVAVDKAGNKTLPSAATVFTTGNATLNGTNKNQIIVSGVAQAVDHYDVLKTNTATFLGTITPGPGGANNYLYDTGQATSAYTAPMRNATGDSTIEGMFADGYGAAVASAATIVPTGNMFHVTGTTTITSIDGTGIKPSTRIRMIFDGALTLTDGSNLKLSGNFVTTADDSITLDWDGSNWYEASRSVN